MPLVSRHFLRLATLLLACAVAGRVLAESSLPKSSPFEPPAGSGPLANAANESHEFAAVSAIEKKTSVYIVDKQLKKGKWIAVGATVDGITVKSYDAEHDTVLVRIGDKEKTLLLRKSSGTAATAAPGVASSAPAAAWNVPPPTNNAPPAGITVPVAPVNAPTATTEPVAVTTPAVPQPPPPAPGTVAHQEREARMLVSDLLEIGMAQRKAYEEAQKKAAQEKAGALATPPRGSGN